MEFRPEHSFPPVVFVRRIHLLLISLFYVRRGSLPWCERWRKQGILRGLVLAGELPFLIFSLRMTCFFLRSRTCLKRLNLRWYLLFMRTVLVKRLILTNPTYSSILVLSSWSLRVRAVPNTWGSHLWQGGRRRRSLATCIIECGRN